MTPEQNKALSRLFPNSAAGMSYSSTLRAIAAESPNIKRIFEWGPGRSTIILHELFPSAEIHGIEHDPSWYPRCERLMGAIPKVRIAFQRIEIQPQIAGAYVTAPLYLDKFDLMFVDGRFRRECLGVAQFCLNDGGLVVLHDARRKAYHPAFQFYHPSEIVDDTIVLRPLNQRA
jgi:predicted O-methyltransferase YrrM